VFPYPPGWRIAHVPFVSDRLSLPEYPLLRNKLMSPISAQVFAFSIACADD